MADHRKTFRPRRLAFDGRSLPRGRRLGAALALLGALTTAQILESGPALAQEAGLKSGVASLTAGKYDAAVRQLSATINDENATPGQAAKALYLRGIAYRKLGQQGAAIADLGAALWLGLPAADKVRALVNKGLAYKAAGLSSQGDAAIAQARSASSSSAVDKVIAEDSGGGGVASADPGTFNTEVSSGGGESASSGESVWSRLVPSFGGSSSSPPPAPAPTPSAPTETAAAPPPTAGWGASVSDETATQSSGSGVSRWFGSLTGDSAPAATSPGPAATTTAPPRTTTAERTAAAPTPAPPSASSWAANTETTKVASESSGSGLGRWFGGGSSESAPAPAATPQASGGGYRVQLANSRSQAEAQALWKRVSKSNRQLASAAPQIDTVDIGSFGTFYSLKIGPFATEAEGTKLCNALKRGGTDCSVVSPDGP